MSQSQYQGYAQGQGPAAPYPQGQPGCMGCPVAQIPEHVWKSLFKPPFRKRHPVVFWLSWALALIVFVCLCAVASDDDGAPSEESIALVSVNGVISDNMKLLRWIKTISESDNVKGVLLRVDSPGGGAAASNELYMALKALGKKKPIAVSMGSAAASGGLMVSMAGERVFASGSTVTGSIGVRMDIMQLRKLADTLGVGQETLTSGPFKDAGSVLRPLSPEEREYLMGVIRDMHGQFVDIVAEGRRMPREKVEALANGKIYTGREAVANGLVDELGDMQAAHAWLCQKTGVPEKRKLAKMPKDKTWLKEQMETLLRLDLRELASEAARTGPVFSY